jgi:hypothetical protein
MKHIILLSIAALLWTARVLGQGMLIYDQQSATNGIGTFGAHINLIQPGGQSFTPSLSGVGFVEFQLRDRSPSPGVAAIIAVNLWSGSIGGTLLGSTEPVSLPAGFFGNTNFLFSAPVPVVSETRYYFQPIIQSGGNDDWLILGDRYNYPVVRGTYIFRGIATEYDLWFREGIVVPEPLSFYLILFGLGGLLLFRRIRTTSGP